MTTISLREALESPTTGESSAFCKFTKIREQLTAEEQAALDKAVNGIREDAGLGKAKTYSTTWLTRVLRNFGYTISVSTVQRHVNKECACE